MSKKSKDAISSHDVILEYLGRTNRPYSAIDVFNNLKEKIPKTAVVKTLNQLVEDRACLIISNPEEKIHGKQYGKQWVYVARQDALEAPSQEEINAMDQEIDQFKTTNGNLKDEVSVF